MKKLLFLLIIWSILTEITSPGHSFYFLSFILYVPYFYALYNYQSKWWQISLVFGLFYNFMYFRWLIYPFQYTDIPIVIAILILFLMALALTAFLMLFSFLFVKIFKFKYSFFSAAVFTSLEIIKGVIFTGFPWGDLSYNLAFNYNFIQVASIAGSYFITFVIILINLLIAEYIFYKKINTLTTCFLIFTIFFFANYLLIKNSKSFSKNSKKILLVQGNIPERMKFDEKNAEKILNEYINLTEKNLKKDIDLVVWPESIYIKFLNEDKKLKKQLMNFLLKIKKPIIIGMPSIKFLKNRKYKIYNSLYVFYDKGKYLKYDKVHLVPFGEYTPLKSILSFVNKLVPGVDFSPGEKLKILKFDNFKIIPLICFEGIFPWQILKENRKGGNILVNISNEAWFGKSYALQQHLAANILRAVESGKYFLRCSNSGISAVIDNHGKILKKLGYDIKGTVLCDVNLINNLSFYDRIGYLITFLYFLLSCYGILKSYYKRKIID